MLRGVDISLYGLLQIQLSVRNAECLPSWLICANYTAQLVLSIFALVVAIYVHSIILNEGNRVSKVIWIKVQGRCINAPRRLEMQLVQRTLNHEETRVHVFLFSNPLAVFLDILIGKMLVRQVAINPRRDSSPDNPNVKETPTRPESRDITVRSATQTQHSNSHHCFSIFGSNNHF